jgi:preprotein translocase subunit SecB
MAKTPPPAETITHDAGDVNSMPVVIHAQYIKDLSFENPNAPDTLRPSPSAPQLDIAFSIDARRIPFGDSQSTYEMILGVQAAAKREGKPAFIIELAYAMVVSLNGVPEEHAHPLLLIDMPRYAFPYVRQIISNVTQQGGFVPLQLAPVDFRALYLERFAEGAQKQSA